MFVKKILKYIKFTLLKCKYLFYCFFTSSAKIMTFLENSENYILFITHNFGGGTKQYEENFIADSDNNVFVVRVISYGFDICYSIENKKANTQIYCNIKSLKNIFTLKFKSIVLNSLVSSSRVEIILNNIILCKEKFNIPLTYMIHDYHCICPHVNLIANDEFCKLKCESFNCDFCWFDDSTNMSISEWRTCWNSFLSKVDEIRCFSQSSKTLLQACYEKLDKNKFNILPHSMDYCKFPRLDIKRVVPLNILVIGACHTVPKGRKIIEYLIKNLDKRINITLIGTDYKAVSFKKDDSVSFYGRYNHSDLPNIIEKSNGSLIIFPSICPETFSYLISELIQMNLPILCFDLGAQAEKVKQYSKGLLCNDKEDMIKKIYLYNEVGDEIFDNEK